jgi:hypothetical protein
MKYNNSSSSVTNGRVVRWRGSLVKNSFTIFEVIREVGEQCEILLINALLLKSAVAVRQSASTDTNGESDIQIIALA